MFILYTIQIGFENLRVKVSGEAEVCLVDINGLALPKVASVGISNVDGTPVAQNQFWSSLARHEEDIEEYVLEVFNSRFPELGGICLSSDKIERQRTLDSISKLRVAG